MGKNLQTRIMVLSLSLAMCAAIVFGFVIPVNAA